MNRRGRPLIPIPTSTFASPSWRGGTARRRRVSAEAWRAEEPRVRPPGARGDSRGVAGETSDRASELDHPCGLLATKCSRPLQRDLAVHRRFGSPRGHNHLCTGSAFGARHALADGLPAEPRTHAPPLSNESLRCISFERTRAIAGAKLADNWPRPWVIRRPRNCQRDVRRNTDSIGKPARGQF